MLTNGARACASDEDAARGGQRVDWKRSKSATAAMYHKTDMNSAVARREIYSITRTTMTAEREESAVSFFACFPAFPRTGSARATTARIRIKHDKAAIFVISTEDRFQLQLKLGIRGTHIAILIPGL